MKDEIALPNEQPVLRLSPRVNDSNPSGDIFGGWLMSQIDIAGAIVAARRAKGHVVTVSVNNLTFIKPIFIKDLVSFYANVVKTGTTSLTVDIKVYSQRLKDGEIEIAKVSDAQLVYVAVEKPGKKRSLPPEQ